MTPSDHDLLSRLAIQSSANPTHVTRADLLQLLALAGFDRRSQVWQAALTGDDPMLVDAHSVRVMIDRAREISR